MNARASSTVMLDASTVYAEGFHAGLREASRIVARDPSCTVPLPLRRKITEAEALLIHREWLVSQDRPVPFERSSQALALIHNVLRACGLGGSRVE
jgi:hypothetical protein